MKIQIIRSTKCPAGRPARNRRTATWVGGAVLAVAALSGGEAHSQTTGAVTANLDINPAVRSLLVTGSPTTYSRCWDKSGHLLGTPKMSLPNGVCQATGITVTNTGVDAYVTAETSLMANNDPSPIPGAEWSICTGGGCSNSGLPGRDQFNVMTTTLELPPLSAAVGTLPGGVSPYYAQLNQPQGGLPAACDYSLTSSQSCLLAQGQPGKSLNLLLIGPKTVSLDSASKWVHTVTWTAGFTANPPAPTFSRENQPLRLFYS